MSIAPQYIIKTVNCKREEKTALTSVKLNRNNIPAQQLHHLEILRNVTVLLCVYHTPSVQSKHFIHFSPEKKKQFLLLQLHKSIEDMTLDLYFTITFISLFFTTFKCATRHKFTGFT